MATHYHQEVDNPAGRAARVNRAIEASKKGLHVSFEINPPWLWRPYWHSGAKSWRLCWLCFGFTIWRISMYELVTTSMGWRFPEKF
jgi:hypothetical protein